MAARRVKGSRKLSAREQEVLTLLSAGCTSKAIASQLHVSPNTANYHLANIYRKLGVHSRVAACNAFRRMVLT
jgi:DNA-binding CsgD family transcriptional regulator